MSSSGRQIFSAVTAASLCAGCAGIGYVTENYPLDMKAVHVEMPDDTYRVFDKPHQNVMMVTPSMGSAMGQGFVSGVTLGAARGGAPKPRYEAAALQHLRNTGRENCRIVDFYLIVEPQYEMKYECLVAAPPTARGPARQKRP